jgi:hypothetical protein
MKNSEITDDYINSLCFKLILKDGKSINLIEYDSNIHDVKIREIKVINLKTRLVLNMLNTDKRLLNFKEWRRYKKEDHGTINYLYILSSGKLIQSNEFKSELVLYAKRVDEDIWLHISSNKVIKQIQNILNRYKSENHIS